MPADFDEGGVLACAMEDWDLFSGNDFMGHVLIDTKPLADKRRVRLVRSAQGRRNDACGAHGAAALAPAVGERARRERGGGRGGRRAAAAARWLVLRAAYDAL